MQLCRCAQDSHLNVWLCRRPGDAARRRVYFCSDGIIHPPPPIPTPSPTVADLRPAGANVLFMDGHVEFVNYPGKFPITGEACRILNELDALKSE